jgi:hypothetical protein
MPNVAIAQNRLATVARNFSAHVAGVLAEIDRRQAAELERREAEEAQEREARLARLREEAAFIEQRLPLARKGLERLLSFGSSPEMQSVFANYARLHGTEGREFEIPFFYAERPSGEAWERARPSREARGMRFVKAVLRDDELAITYGSGDYQDLWGVSYESVPAESQVESLLHYTQSPFVHEQRWSLDEMLEEIATAYRADLRLVQNRRQRVYEWMPAHIAFELLVSSSRRTQFDRYALRCLARLEERLAS